MLCPMLEGISPRAGRQRRRTYHLNCCFHHLLSFLVVGDMLAVRWPRLEPWLVQCLDTALPGLYIYATGRDVLGVGRAVAQKVGHRRQRPEEQTLHEAGGSGEDDDVVELAGKEGGLEDAGPSSGIRLAVAGQPVEGRDHHFEPIQPPFLASQLHDHMRFIVPRVPPVVDNPGRYDEPASGTCHILAPVSRKPTVPWTTVKVSSMSWCTCSPETAPPGVTKRSTTR